MVEALGIIVDRHPKKRPKKKVDKWVSVPIISYKDKELFLLRNLGRGRGVGFFDAHNFYPDFILWIVFRDKQYITFIDPYGIRHAKGFDDPKIRFHKEIKVLEKQIGDTSVILDSFIVSATEFQQIKWWDKDKYFKQSDCEKHNIVFQKNDNKEYIGKIFSLLSI